MPFSVFDIAGPIMIGPSSSHTAGACKIGQMAQAIFDDAPNRVLFYLHGSFGEVYKGHATDRALLAGIMKFKTSDPRLKDAFAIAKQRKISYEFIPTDLGPNHHPNTVKIVLEKSGKKSRTVIGSSIGGGNIIITQIDEFPVRLHGHAGKFKTLVICHDAKPGTLDAVTKKIAEKNILIIEAESSTVNGKMMSVINTEGRKMTLEEVLALEKMPGIEFVRSLTKLPH